MPEALRRALAFCASMLEALARRPQVEPVEESADAMSIWRDRTRGVETWLKGGVDPGRPSIEAADADIRGSRAGAQQAGDGRPDGAAEDSPEISADPMALWRQKAAGVAGWLGSPPPSRPDHRPAAAQRPTVETSARSASTGDRGDPPAAIPGPAGARSAGRQLPPRDAGDASSGTPLRATRQHPQARAEAPARSTHPPAAPTLAATSVAKELGAGRRGTEAAPAPAALDPPWPSLPTFADGRRAVPGLPRPLANGGEGSAWNG